MNIEPYKWPTLLVHFRTGGKGSGYRISWFMLFLLHAVGIIGFLSPWSGQFQALAPFHLLLSTALLVLWQEQRNIWFWIFALFAFTIGYVAEIVGVHGGWLFGSYRYGATLGPKILEVPPLIGLNWFMLTLASGSIAHQLTLGRWTAIPLAMLFMVGLDFFIEGVAPGLDFWYWLDGHPPLQNYLGWLFVSAIIFLVYFLLPFKKGNPLAPAFLAVQFLFFIILYLMVE